MNRICLSLLIVLTASLVSCKDDDDDEKPSYSFKDQEAQGKVGNEDWTCIDGYATNDQFFVITLTLEEDGTGCGISAIPARDNVSFITELETGVYLLGTGSTIYSVTLTDADDLSNHHVALEGAIEITSITDTFVSGRLDARLDDGNYVNGNFSVPICK